MVGILLAILVFSLIVFFHELGHFLLAKKNKIRVDEFSIGMGPKLLSKKIGETVYCIKLLPLGGSCMMGEDTDDMSEGSFNSKSVWGRISVIAAGPIFNFILAFVFSVVIVGFNGYRPAIIGAVSEGMPAASAGMQAGDKVLKMNGKRVVVWDDVSYYGLFNPGEKVEFLVERDGQKMTFQVAPALAKNESGQEQYYYGVVSPLNKKANAWEAVKYGAYDVKLMIETTLKSLKMLFTGQASVKDLSGPVGIVNMTNDTYEQTVEDGGGAMDVFLNMLVIGVLLSANLGVMNLLPLPALDGGRLVFLFIEAIRRKRVPPEKEGMVHFVGIILLLALMAFVMFNDIMKLF